MLTEKFFNISYGWEYEIGISTDPDDLGGATNDGITFSFFTAHAKEDLKMEPTFDNFKNLPKEDIYKFYGAIWARLKLDTITDPTVGYIVFDFALNSEFAVKEIQKLLQRYGAKLKDDNIIGLITVASINSAIKEKTAKTVCTDILQIREDYVRHIATLPKQDKYLPGWLNRINDLRKLVVTTFPHS